MLDSLQRLRAQNRAMMPYGLTLGFTVESLASGEAVVSMPCLQHVHNVLPLFPSEGGSIINIGSYVATQMPSQTVVYAATKGAVNTITGVLANELGPRNIRVNALLPGVTATEGFRASGAEGSDVVAGLVRMTSLGRIGQPQDIAEAVVFLATNESRWITGELIHVSGGLR
jgi:3-oxoacyl-[acyl-carrier protein] reductase